MIIDISLGEENVTTVFKAQKFDIYIYICISIYIYIIFLTYLFSYSRTYIIP